MGNELDKHTDLEHSTVGGAMHQEAELIARELSSRSVTEARAGQQRLRDDLGCLSGRDLLDLAKELQVSAKAKGLTNPLVVRPEVDQSLGYPRFTGDEFVILTNPFDGRIESVRPTHEHSLVLQGKEMSYFNLQANAFVDHRAAIAEMKNEQLLSSLRID